MMMKRFGEFLLAKDANAITVAFIAALCPIFNLPTGFIAIIILAYVTLQKGSLSGLWVLMWIALPAIAMLVLKRVGIFDLLLLRCVTVWVLASLLRRYQSWTSLLELVAGVGIVGVAVLHFCKPDIGQWWVLHLTNYLNQMIADTHWKITVTPSELAQRIAPIASGVSIFFFATILFFELMIARLWQAAVMDSKALADELTFIRAGFLSMAALFVLIALILFKMHFALDALPIILFPFFIAGLSAFHYLARQKKSFAYGLIFIYTGLFFVPVLVVSILVLLAFIDMWRNFRKKESVGITKP